MGRIQTNIGLITGMPIGDTVDQLMKLAARPRDMLFARTETLKLEQIAVTELSALLLTVRYITNNLGKEDVYQQRDVFSSNENVLSATLAGEPTKGTYQFTPVRMAQHHQLLSSGFRTDAESLGGGRLTFRYGDHVERSTSLELFGGDQGVTRGLIRITDRSGVSTEIDLSTVQTVDDVLEAINSNTTINVTAVARGDRIRLIDNTGQSVSNLKVQEIGSGTTAASLGLEGIDVADRIADGRDMLRLTRDMELDVLNDGNGVTTSPVFPDIHYELRDGTKAVIDFSPIISGSSEVDKEITLGEILDVINAAEPDKLRVDIAPDGDRLVLTDLTEGDGVFEIESLYESEAVEDLGLDGESVDGVITGRRILGGMKSVLLSSLSGGKGLGDLGALELTDRSGATDTVVLSGAETLDDVIDIINAADVGIVAEINDAKNGIQLTDVTGALASNLIVADADDTATAEKLGINVDTLAEVVNSGDLYLQVVSHNTLLSELNGGAGVAEGKVTIFDSKGHQDWLDVSGEDIETIGDVIRAINQLDVQVFAELNDTGDGIRIRDMAEGQGRIQVYALKSTTAADLHLLGGMVEQEIDGELTQVIDGSTTYTIELGEDDSLEDLRTKINELGAGVSAMTFVDGSSKPYRLSLLSERAGEAGELVVDTSGINFSIQEMVRARDALLVLGESAAAGSNVLISSSSNTFRGVISGVKLEIKQTSTTPVTVTVGGSDVDLVASVQTMVDNYDRFREKLNEYTAYDPETNKASILSGDAAALRLDSELSYFFSGRFFGSGSIQSLAELGVDMKDDGTLQFDSSKLKAKFAQDPEAVKQFFAHENVGLATKFETLAEQFTGPDVSLLANRFLSLHRKIEQNDERIVWLDARLDRQRERLYMQFYQMEMAIGKLQINLMVLDTIKPFTPLTSRSGSDD